MSPTCKLKTFHEYKALVSFKFVNKDSIISITSIISHALCKHSIRYFGNSHIEEEKCLLIESPYFCAE